MRVLSRCAQLPLNLLEGGALIGRPGAAPDIPAFAAEGVAVLVHRALNAVPLPGFSAGDWGSPSQHVPRAFFPQG